MFNRVQAGKARGPNLALPEADVCIDITWFCQLGEDDQHTLCRVVWDHRMCKWVGKRGRVTLLLKDPSRPVKEAKIRGITVSPHISKLEPVASYLVGGMKGISLHEVVRTGHMTLDIVRLQGQVVDVLITGLGGKLPGVHRLPTHLQAGGFLRHRFPGLRKSLGGPYPVGGMRGMSLHEIACTVHFASAASRRRAHHRIGQILRRHRLGCPPNA